MSNPTSGARREHVLALALLALVLAVLAAAYLALYGLPPVVLMGASSEQRSLAR